jgi:hypothetical protein
MSVVSAGPWPGRAMDSFAAMDMRLACISVAGGVRGDGRISVIYGD